MTFIRNEPQKRIWDEIYFNPPMQLTASIFNSVPLYGVLVAIGFWQRGTLWGKIILFFSLAAILHIACDFPVHAHDAYAHFWPFTDWKFHSPLSYWETHLHAKWVGLVESIFGLTSIVILWKRFPKLWVKVLLVVLAALYAVMMVGRWII